MFSNYLIPMLTGIIGLVMIFAAEPIVKVFVVALGIFLIVSGAYILTELSKLIEDKYYRINTYVRGAVSVILGLVCVILPIAMANFAWKVMMVILGIYAVISAGSEIATVMKLNEAGFEVKKYIIEVVGTIIAAVVLFLLPSSFGFTLIRIGGGVLILIAIVLAIGVKKNEPIVEEDAEVVDDD